MSELNAFRCPFVSTSSWLSVLFTVKLSSFSDIGCSCQQRQGFLGFLPPTKPRPSQSSSFPPPSSSFLDTLEDCKPLLTDGRSHLLFQCVNCIEIYLCTLANKLGFMQLVFICFLKTYSELTFVMNRSTFDNYSILQKTLLVSLYFLGVTH